MVYSGWGLFVLEWVFAGGVLGPIFMMSAEKKHMLSYLLLLETAGMGLFVGAFVGFYVSDNCEMVLLVMGIGACEAAVGLGVLISLARVKGNDFVESSFSIKV